MGWNQSGTVTEKGEAALCKWGVITKTAITIEREGAKEKGRYIRDQETLLYKPTKFQVLSPTYKGRYYM